MGYAVEGYCYETVEQAVLSFNSHINRWFFDSDNVAEINLHADGLYYLHSFSKAGLNHLEVLTNKSLVSCPDVGPLNPIVYGVDWSVVEWIFGSGLVLFAVGAGIGAVLNIVRKARI